MEDDNERLETIDRETELVYHDMYQFLKDNHREVKVMDHRYTVRATTGGRVRGLYTGIFKALKEYYDHKLAPGLLVRYVEQSKAQIAKSKEEPNKKKTTMLILSEEGFAESDENAPKEFTKEELMPLEERCRAYWQANPEHYKQTRMVLQRRFPHLTDTQITSAFLKSLSDGDVLRHLTLLSHSVGAGVGIAAVRADSDDDDDDTDDDDTYIPIIKDEDIANLKALFPSFSDEQLKRALIDANGQLDLAADNMFRN